MAIPHDKITLLQAIHTTFEKLEKDLKTVPVEHSEEKSMEGHAKGTNMSPANLVAYLIGWGELVLKWHQLIADGKAVDFPETGYKWTELGALAQQFYRDYEDLNFEESLERLSSTVGQIVALIEATDPNELYGTPWYKNYPMGRMIQLNTSSPYKNARIRIRKWKKNNL